MGFVPHFSILAIMAVASLAGADFKVSAPKTPIKTPPTLPACVRPQDFSVEKEVSLFENCVALQDKYCDIHDSSSECKKLLQSRMRTMIRAGTEVDPTKICAVQKDGSYQCQHETVRFIVKEEPAQPSGSPGSQLVPKLTEDDTVAPAPAPAPGAPGTQSPSSGADGNPNGTNPAPFVPLPAPPGYVPPNGR